MAVACRAADPPVAVLRVALLAIPWVAALKVVALKVVALKVAVRPVARLDCPRVEWACPLAAWVIVAAAQMVKNAKMEASRVVDSAVEQVATSLARSANTPVADKVLKN